MNHIFAMFILAILSLACFAWIIKDLLEKESKSLSFLVKSVFAWAAIIGLVTVVAINRSVIAGGFDDLEHWANIGNQRTDGRTIRIAQSDNGHYYARAKINGVTRSMMIDSGASTIALSQATAMAAGVAIDKDREPIQINTANGVVPAWPARLKQFDIDGLHTADIDIVVAPSMVDIDLIGMNFLSRLKSWRVESGTLVLEPMETRESSDTDVDLT